VVYLELLLRSRWSIEKMFLGIKESFSVLKIMSVSGSRSAEEGINRI